MLGEGPEQERLESLAQELGIFRQSGASRLAASAEVIHRMKTADVLIHPSLRDGGGTVLLEAMTQERPVICLDLTGPDYIVTPECGFKSRRETVRVVEELGAALTQLAGDPALRQEMGRAGSRRVRERFDWQSRGKQMLE